MQQLIYFMIALLATTLGTMAGLGGGVIIKPALDALGDYNVSMISVLSSATVLSMAIVSTIKRLACGIKFDKKLMLLTIGAIAGGFIGKQAFEAVLSRITPEQLTMTQAVMIAVLMVIVLFKNKLPHWHIKQTFLVLFAGIILGALSSFLGIGGGPINVAILCLFFSMNIKEAAAGSIFIILFSQLSKIISIALSTGFGADNYSILLFMIPAGIIGGLIGPVLRGKVSDQAVDRVFSVTVIFVIALNIYNILAI